MFKDVMDVITMWLLACFIGFICFFCGAYVGYSELNKKIEKIVEVCKIK